MYCSSWSATGSPKLRLVDLATDEAIQSHINMYLGITIIGLLQNLDMVLWITYCTSVCTLLHHSDSSAEPLLNRSMSFKFYREPMFCSHRTFHESFRAGTGSMRIDSNRGSIIGIVSNPFVTRSVPTFPRSQDSGPFIIYGYQFITIAIAQQSIS